MRMANQQNQENQQTGARQRSSYNYRNLVVWRQAQDLALEVIKVAGRLPNTGAAAVLARQLVASAASIGANIAEGHGRFSLAAYRNHLSIAKGSAFGPSLSAALRMPSAKRSPMPSRLPMRWSISMTAAPFPQVRSRPSVSSLVMRPFS